MIDTIRHDAWSDEELQVLYDRVNETPWFDEAAALLPTRTEKAIRHRMWSLRDEARIVPMRRVPASKSAAKTYDEKVAAASRQLLVAIYDMMVAELARKVAA